MNEYLDIRKSHVQQKANECFTRIFLSRDACECERDTSKKHCAMFHVYERWADRPLEQTSLHQSVKTYTLYLYKSYAHRCVAWNKKACTTVRVCKCSVGRFGNVHTVCSKNNMWAESNIEEVRIKKYENELTCAQGHELENCWRSRAQEAQYKKRENRIERVTINRNGLCSLNIAFEVAAQSFVV